MNCFNKSIIKRLKLYKTVLLRWTRFYNQSLTFRVFMDEGIPHGIFVWKFHFIRLLIFVFLGNERIEFMNVNMSLNDKK